MRDGFSFTDCNARCRLCTKPWFARSAGVTDLLPLLMFDEGHGFFPKDIDLIGTHFKGLGWADFHTPTASIAFVGVDDDIPIAGTILKTIIGNHVIPVGGFRLEVGGKTF